MAQDKRFQVINFSGGRSSAYMLRMILNINGGLPDNSEVIFCNTGKELEATLRFVKECQTRWDVPITWLEYRYIKDAKGGIKDPKNHYEIVDFETASRNGEPFVQLIEKSQMLPNVVTRKCTSELKVETIRRHMLRDKGIGGNDYTNVLGIRADEPRRVYKALIEQCKAEYPLFDANVTKYEVDEYWSNSDFDLGIDSIYGNCDLCFLKGRKNLVQSIRANPSLADWWIEQEQKVWKKHAYDAPAQFIKRATYTEMRDYALSQQAIDFGDDPVLDCFCGD